MGNLNFKTRNAIVFNRPVRVFAMFLNDSPNYGGDAFRNFSNGRLLYTGKCFLERRSEDIVDSNYEGYFIMEVNNGERISELSMKFPSLKSHQFEKITIELRVNTVTGHFESKNVWSMNFEQNPISIYGNIFGDGGLGVSGKFYDSNGRYRNIGIFAGIRRDIKNEKGQTKLSDAMIRKVMDSDDELVREFYQRRTELFLKARKFEIDK